MQAIDELITGQSAPIKELKNLIEIVAPSASSVLIQGETGTGKDVVANAIHAASQRNGRMVSVNCAAIPSELLESELFGHEKGSFTGADQARQGRFELANGGTLFLDEIGDMNLNLQSKLLRALESRTIQRVGGSDDIPVDFRLVCATHRNLDSYVDDGRFRADLFFRINVFPIQVPSLAERSVDVPALVDTIISQIEPHTDQEMPTFDESALGEMSRYNWPGNVRELRNIGERAVLLFSGRTVTGKEVRNNLLRLRVPSRNEEQEALWAASQDLEGISGDTNLESQSPLPHPTHYKEWFAYFDSIDLRRHLRDVEVVLIEAALEKTNGTISSAADALNLRRTTLIEKMKKLMIEKSTDS